MNVWNIVFVVFGAFCVLAKQHSQFMKQFKEYRLRGSSLRITDVWSDIECVHLCLSDPRCASVNCRRYRESSAGRRCHLNSKTRRSSPQNFLVDKHCNYYEPILVKETFSEPDPITVGKSCLDILHKSQTKLSGEYKIKIDGDAKPMNVFCDMETDDGGWTLVSNIVYQTSKDFKGIVTDDYHMIANYSRNYLVLSTQALGKLRQQISFTQLRFFCHKKIPGRTFHIVTNTTTLGEHVIKYFTAKTDVLPLSCGSFYPLPDDDSLMANDCKNWGCEDGTYRVGKWHHSGMSLNERLLNHPAFISHQAHWVLKNRWECDDFFLNNGFAKSAGDFWKIFVR